ncbi:hypothetical protein [Peribacillus frigoritolerans]|uniref:O-antigen ligase family protein n=1 Tax=Peribacillus frigoritolerans TaxID=450367 RepID=UPI002E1DBD55|nr:hypothetical protein [Peribacillus frigoritolerans]
MNAYISLGLCLLPICFLSNKFKIPMLKIFSIICFSLSLFTTLQLGNRTGLVIVIISIFMVLFLTDKMGMKKIISILSLMLFLLIVNFLYKQNFWGLKFVWENSYMHSRFTSSNLEEDPRFTAWKSAFWGLFEHPFGGRETEIAIGYAHNLWLDIGYDVGVLPLLILLVFTLISLKSVILFIKFGHPVFLKGLIIALYTSFIITFFVEPILQGLIIYFTFFCFIVGAVQRLNFDLKRSKL